MLQSRVTQQEFAFTQHRAVVVLQNTQCDCCSAFASQAGRVPGRELQLHLLSDGCALAHVHSVSGLQDCASMHGRNIIELYEDLLYACCKFYQDHTCHAEGCLQHRTSCTLLLQFTLAGVLLCRQAAGLWLHSV